MNDPQSNVEATTRYMHASLETFTRAVDLDLLTVEQVVNTLLATASLIASAEYGAAGAADLLEQRVRSLADEMRGARETLN